MTTSSVRTAGAGGSHHVLCLHGWLGSARGWGYWPEVANLTGFTYHFLELRGYGARKAETGTYSMAEFAEDALAYADAQGLDRFSVVGHSMGGKAAAVLAAQAPERIRAVAAITPVPPTAVPMDEVTSELFFGAATEPDNRRTIIDVGTGKSRPSWWLDRMVGDSLHLSTPEAFDGAARSWIGDDYGDLVAAGGGATPLLLVVGALDPSITTEVMRQTWLTLFDDAVLAELPSAGHYPMFETPLELAAHVGTFLGEH